MTTAFNPFICEPIKIPINTCVGGKSPTLMSGYFKYGIATMVTNPGFKTAPAVAQLINLPCIQDVNDKEAITTTDSNPLIAEPVCMRYERSEKAKRMRKDYESGKIKHGFHEFSELHPRQDGKTNTLSTVLKDNPICEPIQVGALPRPNGELSTSQAFRIYDTDAKSVSLKANGGGAGGKTGLYACPVILQKARGYNKGGIKQDKSPTVTSNSWQENNKVLEQVDCMCKCIAKQELGCVLNNISDCKTVEKSIPEISDKLGFVPVMFNAYNRSEIKDKSPILSTGSMATSSCATCKFEPVCKFVNTCVPYFNNCHNKEIYEVKDGLITIKGNTYPIKLKDGYYIIRKLTVEECKRLQTVPEWFEFPVSNSQAYKQLGNGWTVDVITHLISSAIKGANYEQQQT